MKLIAVVENYWPFKKLNEAKVFRMNESLEGESY